MSDNKIYCVKCRDKVDCTDVQVGEIEFQRKKTGKKGVRYSLMAKCPNCGTSVKRFIKKPEAASAPQ
jgi:hypothetical protein